jgi:hypothetical protein
VVFEHPHPAPPEGLTYVTGPSRHTEPVKHRG